MTEVRRLLESVPRRGRLEWIGLSPARRAPIEVVQEAEVREGTGLVGDHHARTGRGKRQVTLVQAEHLPVVAALLGREEVRPEELRRNLVVAGINLLGLRGARFAVGEVLLEGTGSCAPCSRMEEDLGPGGHHAVRGHGGVTARVLRGGRVRVGDEVTFVELADAR